jgi:hypothetical protein
VIKENNIEYITGIVENPIIKKYFEINNIILSKKRPESDPSRNIIFNLSQCSKKNICDQIKLVLSNGYKVIDCSLSNVKLCGNYEKHIYIPYQIQEDESILLKDMLNKTKKYDICFIGTISEYRKRILNDFKKSKLKILVLENIYGIERDAQVAQCKLLLNIHYNYFHKVYECLRCDRWSLNGMMVVTEESIFNFYNETEELISISTCENLKNKVIEILDNYEEYYKSYISKLDKIIDIKKMERKNYLRSVWQK